MFQYNSSENHIIQPGIIQAKVPILKVFGGNFGSKSGSKTAKKCRERHCLQQIWVQNGGQNQNVKKMSFLWKFSGFKERNQVGNQN